MLTYITMTMLLMKKSQKAYLVLKRIIDIFGSIVGMCFCLGFLWWWVFIINIIVTKGHPIFIQERVGYKKRVFKCLKFRSMKLDAKEIAPNDMTPELQKSMETGFGKFLRKTSIDETPQLINILVGHMSFIGPRPGAAHNEESLIKIREEYTPNAFEVKPGLGGLAQAKMRRDHDPHHKAQYDSEYVKNLSLWLDIKIFFMTLFHPFGGR